MKKKLLIFSHAMEIGGAERALLGLLENIDTNKYDVDLFLMRHSGELMKNIPNEIHLLDEIAEYSCLAVPIFGVIKKKKIKVAIGRINGKIAARKYIKENNLQENDVALEYSHKYTLNAMPPINNKLYDLGISFLTPHYFCAEKVNAKKRIAWIHTDYSYIDVDVESQLQMWGKYDWIGSISKEVTDAFLLKFPSLIEKTVLLPNIMPTKYLVELTGEKSVEDEMVNDGSIKLLSIGRFCKQKNFDNVPIICDMLIKQGINIKWYLIGYGSDEQFIRSKIEECGMENRVIILGKKENPYPYIKACDFYVQPSRYEGKCVSVIEAQILNKPVIITSYPTANSQLMDGIDGLIVPMENEECAKAIANIIQDASLRMCLIKNTMSRDYTNAEMISTMESLLGW